jgi:hypothetical protein
MALFAEPDQLSKEIQSSDCGGDEHLPEQCARAGINIDLRNYEEIVHLPA